MDLQECFEDTIKDIYSAEKQLLKALPKMVKLAKNPQLKKSIETHITETEGQIKRLEQIAQSGGFKPTGMLCKGMQGLIEECNEHMGELKPGPVADAVIIMLAQKNEHYEIGAYGSVIAWAKALGNSEAIDLLTQTLNEEERTDNLLSELAESSVNAEAASAPSEAPKKKTSTTTRAKAPAKSATAKKVSVR